MRKTTSAAVVAAILAGVATAGEVRTVYREWFDHYQERTPAFNAGTTITEMKPTRPTLRFKDVTLLGGASSK